MASVEQQVPAGIATPTPTADVVCSSPVFFFFFVCMCLVIIYFKVNLCSLLLIV